MKKNILVGLLIIETVIIFLGLLSHLTGYSGESDDLDKALEIRYDRLLTEAGETELLRELSPDGNYTLLIRALGAPRFPFGKDELEVTLFEMIPENERPGVYYSASFRADVANDGCRAEYKVEWLEDSVQIALSGQEQPTAYYVLPFKTLKE